MIEIGTCQIRYRSHKAVSGPSFDRTMVIKGLTRDEEGMPAGLVSPEKMGAKKGAQARKGSQLGLVKVTKGPQAGQLIELPRVLRTFGKPGVQVAARPAVGEWRNNPEDRSGDHANPAVVQIETLGMEAADHIIAVSDYTRQLIADRYGIYLLEDCAHCTLGEYKGKKLGTWGHVGTFSFNMGKPLATGEGGMLVTRQDALAEKLRLLRSHGMTSLTWDRHQGHAYSYDVVDLGYNYRTDEIRSALGLAQLGKLAGNNHRRRELTGTYWAATFNNVQRNNGGGC